MKKYAIALVCFGLVFQVSSFARLQLEFLMTPSTTLSNLNYISGEAVNGTIEIPENDEVRVQGAIDLSNPNGIPGVLRLYVTQCSGCFEQEKSSITVFNGSPFDVLSIDLVLSDAEYNSGGSLFGRFTTSGGIEYNTQSIPINIIEDDDDDDDNGGSTGNPPLVDSFNSCTGPSFLAPTEAANFGPNTISSEQTTEAGTEANRIYSTGAGANGISNFIRFFWVKWELGNGTWVEIDSPAPAFQPGLFLDPGVMNYTTRFRRIAEVDVNGSPKWICSYSNVIALSANNPNIAPSAQTSHSQCDGSFLNDSCMRERYATDLRAYNDHVDPVIHNGNVRLSNGDTFLLEWASEITTDQIYIDWSSQPSNICATCARAIPDQFKLEYFDGSLNQWVVLAERTPASGNAWYSFEFDAITTRKIRINTIEANNDGFAEIYVFGAYNDTQNKALTATLTGDSGWSFGLYPIGNVNDGLADLNTQINPFGPPDGPYGDFNAMWLSTPVGSTAHATSWSVFGGWAYEYGPYTDVAPAYLQLDWASMTEVSEVRIVSPENMVPRDFDIEYWDGSNWQTASSVALNSDQVAVSTFSTISTTKLRVKFTRINENNSLRPMFYRAAIVEIEVF